MGNVQDVKRTHESLVPQTVDVASFEIDSVTASNADFREFVRRTKFQTESETFGWSFVLDLHTTDASKQEELQSIKEAAHWLAVPGAYWRSPNGKGSGIKDILDHPAVHLSWNDAKAYCEWRGMRLPTETEWEYAARGGLKGKRYPWGDSAPKERGDGRMFTWKLNLWQGEFPDENTEEDGFSATAPVDSFKPNEWGLYNMVGNVWEWTATEDISKQGQYVLRGGSFLDSVDGTFNHPASINTRMTNSPDSASSNTAVRCVKDVANDGKGKRRKRKKGYEYIETEEQKRAKRKEKLKNLDQEKLAKIAEEGGIEALQEFLGDAAQVTTPEMLKKRQEELKRMREEL